MITGWFRILRAFIREHMEDRQYLQNVLGNIGWLFTYRVVRLGIGLVVGVWVARYLGPERYGVLNYSFAFVLLFSSVASMGLETVAVRDLVRDPSRKDEILGTVFLLEVIGGVVAFSMAIGTISVVRSEDSLTRWMVCIIAAGWFFQTFDAIDYWFQSQILSKYTVIARSAAFFSISFLKVGLILLRAPVIYFAIAATAEIVLGSAFLIAAYYVNGHGIRKWRILPDTAKTMLKDSWPLLFSGIFVMLYIRIDQVMIGEILGDSETGIYSAAVTLAEAWYFIPIAITSSVLPAIVDAKKRDEGLYYSRLEKLFLAMFWLSLSVSVLITIFAKNIVHLVFGAQYANAAYPLAIQCWAGLFIFSGLVSNQWYLVENLNRYTLYRHVTGAAVNVFGNLALIPRYGIDGAAVSTLLTQFFASYLFDSFNAPSRVLFQMKTRTYFLFIPDTYRYITMVFRNGKSRNGNRT
jgi:PST family polysaccharide transporter